MSYIQEYIDLANLPRVSNRAKAHFITTEELSTEFGEEYEEILEGEFDEYKDGLKRILVNRQADLRRGDFIFIEHEVGYRNQGKVMYDGENVITLGYDMDDYGCIPEEFQIGEFPPKYWFDLIDHNNFAPFNFNKHLSHYTVNDITYMVRKDNGMAHLCIPFTVNGNKYAVIKVTQLSVSAATDTDVLRGFLDQVKEQTHFEFHHIHVHDTDPLSLPDDWSYEQLLFVTDY